MALWLFAQPQVFAAASPDAHEAASAVAGDPVFSGCAEMASCGSTGALVHCATTCVPSLLAFPGMVELPAARGGDDDPGARLIQLPVPPPTEPPRA